MRHRVGQTFQLGTWAVTAFGLAVLWTLAGSRLPAREWSDASGSFRVEAEFVEFQADKVVLRRTNGTTLSVARERLSQLDQDYLVQFADAQAEGEDERAGDTAPARPKETSDKPAEPPGTTLGGPSFANKKGDSGSLSIGLQTAAELEKLAARQTSLETIISLYKFFIRDQKISESERQTARERLKHYEEMLASGAKRIGTKWVSGEQLQKLQGDEARLMEEAWRLIELGNDKLTEDRLLAASKANPEGIQANFVLGILHALKLRKAASAEQHFREVVRRRQSSAATLNHEERGNLIAALNNLALAEIRQRKYDEALKHWRLALAQAPPPAEVIQNLGRLVYLAEQNRKLGIPAGAAKAAGKLYAEVAVSAEAVPFDPKTGWLYVCFFSGDEPALKTPEKKKGGKKTSRKPTAKTEKPPSSERQPDQPPAGKGGLVVVGTGSGFVVQSEYIITNRHVAEDSDGLAICEQGDVSKRHEARLVATSTTADLAVLHCPGLAVKPVAIHSSLPRLGSDVLVLGFPRTDVLGTGLKATRGSVSGLPTPQTEDALLFDAVVNPGNSGGPVCDQQGRIVAVCRGYFLVDQKISCGVPSTVLRDFCAKQIPGYREVAAGEPARDWADVTEEVGASTVWIHILKRPKSIEVPRSSSDRSASSGKSGKEPPREWKAFEDPWCMACNGHGDVDCPVRNCTRGTVPAHTGQVVGRNPVSGQPIVESMTTRALCPTCRGKGRVRCEACLRGIDPSLLGGR